METTGDAYARERFLGSEAVANLCEDGHEGRGPLDARAACVSEAPVFDVPKRTIDGLQQVLL